MSGALKELLPETDVPFYQSTGNEEQLFEAAWRQHLPLLLKGPTGCGKTRFVSHMAAKLGVPLYTVSCHDDLTAADLTGRYLIKGGETVWVDGPLTRAVRHGGICYLDEVVEARKDVTVVLHPLTDDRRLLPLDRTGELLEAPDNFMLVVSYNPGYQNLLKQLKPSTRQRFLAAEFTFPDARTETEILMRETGIDHQTADLLVRIASSIRNLAGIDLEEAASTRLLIYCATLLKSGVAFDDSVTAAIVEPLSDDADIKTGLHEAIGIIRG
ncbi:CbbQ/NirQ/NorQ/GpvN family protein [Thalassospira sp.]|uniref:CbbQ/NirQ/NorQ/GpvN family protein n=1 Tax=Thalassospira sp. TaxID=1912094 RepID=UPI003AA94A11